MKPDSSLPAPLPAPDPLADDIVDLLDGITATPAAAPPLRRLRQRLMRRVQRAAEAGRAFETLRANQMSVVTVAPGVSVRCVHRNESAGLRPGEPQRALLVEFAPGGTWTLEACGSARRREWLVVRGSVELNGQALPAHCYVVGDDGPGGGAVVRSAGAALLYLRETPSGGERLEAPWLQHDEPTLWLDYAPGIKRRLLWQHGGQAAMLYHALPGAEAPGHTHEHDEECLMLEGELFLDDILLRSGEYQIAPAGTGHGGVSTDTGALLYAHGDLELHLLPL